ncbi:MAG: gas vesicle protein GvpJ [Bacillota bacterium]
MGIKTAVQSSSLAEVLDRVLDKGIVIDLYAIVSLVGIELLAVEARVVIASVETWLVYAEAVGLLTDKKHHPKRAEAIPV